MFNNNNSSILLQKALKLAVIVKACAMDYANRAGNEFWHKVSSIRRQEAADAVERPNKDMVSQTEWERILRGFMLEELWVRAKEYS